MRVGINCLQIDPSYAGGVNSYTLGLLRGFAGLENGCRYRLYVTRANQHLFESFRGRRHFEVVIFDDFLVSLKRNVCRAALLSSSREFYKRASDLAFRTIRDRMDSESDVIYTPTVVLLSFSQRKPTLLSMHDIQHVHYPEFFTWARRLSRTITYGLSARFASYFQASSHFIKEDLLHHFPEVASDRVEVIPEGVNIEEFAARADCDSRLERYRLPNRFLFLPAQLWPHKNHLTVLKALKRLETEHGLKIPLVLTGDGFSATPRIFEFIAEQSMDSVHYLGKVPFPDLVALYQKAAFLVTAVLYESSSLPILEAAAAGTPILASRTPPNEELARVLRMNLFHPLDAEELAQLIRKLWADERVARAQAAHNREHVAFYSWENAARKYAHLFDKIVSS